MTTDEDVVQLDQKFPCRSTQISALTTLFAPEFPTPPTIVIHGLEATGKSTITRAVLSSIGIPHAIVDSRECITARHLLEQASALSRQAAARGDPTEDVIGNLSKCETVNTLENHLEKVLKNVPKFVLVFDGVDRQREMAPILLPALARLGTVIPNLCVVFIVSLPSPRMLFLPGMPHIHFDTYKKEAVLKIVSQEPPEIFLGPVEDATYGKEEADEDNAWLWSRYIAVVWDSVGKGAARDLQTFTAVCHKLWRPFVQPIVDGTFGTRDFSKLLVSRRVIFQNEDFLTGNTLRQGSTALSTSSITNQKRPSRHELPYYTKFILCAAYLASYNPSRQDKIYFMKTSERRKRKRGGTAGGRVSKHRKIPRHLLNPSPFTLDRLLAILHAILPHSLPQQQMGPQIATQIATLASLRLLLRTGAVGSLDVLDPAMRFRVHCTWDFVSSLGRSVGVEMRDYLAT